jgi:hypothetical protein
LPSEASLTDIPFEDLNDSMTAWRVVMEKREERQEAERREAQWRAGREAGVSA